MGADTDTYDTHDVMDKIKAGAPGLLELIGYNTKLTKTTPTLLKIHIFYYSSFVKKIRNYTV